MDDDQQFCLRWNNHQSTLVAVFDTLLENGTLVDCTLAAEGKCLNAHKVVLSACSPYFEALLSRHFDKHPILILKDVKFQELKAMMDYMYRGEVNISQDQLGALLKAAESLQIKGLSDNRKGETERKPAPIPPPPKSPQPTSALPKVQGLTIEQRSREDSREGSMSPGPRKKKRLRRKSEELDNHDASNSSESHSLPAQNIPSSLPAVSKINADVPEPVETKSEILRHKQPDDIPQVPIIKEKLETHTELMLEPKSEYVEEMNEDSIEDLTLDDDDLSNMEQMDDQAGPSHGNAGEGSSQGFGGWHMGNQSQDEVFLAAQEAVGAHRDSQATEVRCQEKTRGGLRYEVILGEPEVKATPPKKQLSPKSSMSVQDIEDKLKAAEERRQQLESNKIAALSAKMQKIEEASRKKEEQTSQFITATRDALEQKMEHYTEKREAYITDLKTKLKDHIENVEKTRLTLEQQTDEVRTAIEEKLKTASQQRDGNIKKMLERLKEHEEQVQKVRVQNTIKLQQLDSAIQEKLGQAQSRKEQLEQEQKEKLRNHNNRPIEVKQTVESTVEVRKTEVAAHVENKLTIAEQNRELEIKKKLDIAKKHNEHMVEVKQTIESNEENRKTEKVNKIETKLTAAEQKREQELQRKLEKIKENEKRAETVRQNKANIVANKMTPSSG